MALGGLPCLLVEHERMRHTVPLLPETDPGIDSAHVPVADRIKAGGPLYTTL